MQNVEWTKNKSPKGNDRIGLMSEESVSQAINFHKSFPQYSVTPLADLKNMAKFLGVKNIYVKDESYRFGLNAFKVLGGSFSIAHHIADVLKRDISMVDYNYLTSKKLKEEFGTTTFFTATDGNHGRGVAWSANIMGQKAVVRMPHGTSLQRLQNILKENAEATIEDMNYDACVRLAAKEAKAAGGVIVQDTAWQGYEVIPTYIMQGYGTMAMEAATQVENLGEKITHIFIGAGVGSLAGAIVGFFANRFSENPPKFIIMEPLSAACHYKSAVKGDGSTSSVDGDMKTIMAGLACGEVNMISWDILKNHADAFVACPDNLSALGMRMLGAPLKGDDRVISGESGAIGMGLLASLMDDEKLEDLRTFLEIGENSNILLFSTEGDTDPENYRRIVWNGDYSIADKKQKEE